MSRLGINTGSNPNDGQGDPLRIAMGKINSNFTEIYNTIGDGDNLTSYASTAGISTLARNLTGSPRINVSGILNTGITTTEHIEVRNITSTGVVTATQFVGDGSQLSNVTALVGGLEVLDDNVRKGIARELNFGSNIVSTGPDGVGRVTISVPTTLTATVGYSSISGISTVAQGLTGTPNLNVGVVTATSFIGDGSQLTGISGAVGSGGTWAVTNVGIYTTKNVGIGTTAKNNYALSVSSGSSTNGLTVDGFSVINNVRFGTTTQGFTKFLFPDFQNTISGDQNGWFTGIQSTMLGDAPFQVINHAKFNTTLQIGTSFYDIGTGTPLYPGVFIDGKKSTISVGFGISLNGQSGVITATAFVGDGSGLTNLPGGVGAGGTWSVNAAGIHTSKNVGIGTTISSSALTVEGDGRFSGVVTATRFESTSSGTPTIDSPNNLNINAINVAISTDLTVGGQISANQVGISSYLSVSGVSSFYNNVHIESERAILIGDNDELQLFHSGVDSYIDNNSAGNLIIRDSGIGIQLRRSGGGPSAGLMAAFNNDAGVELYYDSVLKLQTFQNGVAINDSVGIGTTAGNPPYRLTVSGIGATITQGLLNAIADLTSSVDGYGQVNIRNSLSAPNASGDLVITADTGSDTSNYIDLGINNTGFSTSSWTINGPLDGYLYSSDSNLSIGVASTNKYFSIFAGGTLIENEKVRVTETGVGIGTTNPTSDFHVQGDLFASGVITTTDALFTGNISILGDFNKVDSNGIITARTGLTIGVPEIVNGIKSRLSADGSASFSGIVTSGISIPTELRTRSVAEKTTLISGNTVGLAFTTGGGNVAICTNPSGDITLNVTDIPTDSSFDNHSISFSVFVNQTGTARTCTTVTLNGVSKTIKWAGGSLASAISGVTTSTGFDIFTFTGINTVGSASTTDNYVILGSVNGGFN